MELCSVLCASLDGREVRGRVDTCICMAESLHSSPETITTLLIGYTPIQFLFCFVFCPGVKKKQNPQLLSSKSFLPGHSDLSAPVHTGPGSAAG